MLPEVLIITLIMLNEIRLRLIGLYFENESAIESIEEGIQRNIEQGDSEKVAQKKILMANMQLSRFFVIKEKEKKPDGDLAELQDQTLKDLSFNIEKSSKMFNIDNCNGVEHSHDFDSMVADQTI